MARRTTAPTPVTPTIVSTNGRYMYTIVEQPETTVTRAPNPHSDGVAQAKSNPGKALQFGVTAERAASEITLLRRAGADHGVTVRTIAKHGGREVKEFKATGDKVTLVYKGDGGESTVTKDTTITLIFWTVDRITKTRKAKAEAPSA